jgi:hypothetical protein
MGPIVEAITKGDRQALEKLQQQFADDQRKVSIIGLISVALAQLEEELGVHGVEAGSPEHQVLSIIAREATVWPPHLKKALGIESDEEMKSLLDRLEEDNLIVRRVSGIGLEPEAYQVLGSLPMLVPDPNGGSAPTLISARA